MRLVPIVQVTNGWMLSDHSLTSLETDGLAPRFILSHSMINLAQCVRLHAESQVVIVVNKLHLWKQVVIDDISDD